MLQAVLSLPAKCSFDPIIAIPATIAPRNIGTVGKGDDLNAGQPKESEHEIVACLVKVGKERTMAGHPDIAVPTEMAQAFPVLVVPTGRPIGKPGPPYPKQSASAAA